MKQKLIETTAYWNLLLERRMERAFSYAIRKGLSPVEHMRESADMLAAHLIRLKLTHPGSQVGSAAVAI